MHQRTETVYDQREQVTGTCFFYAKKIDSGVLYERNRVHRPIRQIDRWLRLDRILVLHAILLCLV